MVPLDNKTKKLQSISEISKNVSGSCPGHEFTDCKQIFYGLEDINTRISPEKKIKSDLKLWTGPNFLNQISLGCGVIIAFRTFLYLQQLILITLVQ